MSSIAVVFKEKASGPYVKDLKAKVVAVDSLPVVYRGKDGQMKESLTCAVSDGTDVVKMVCYDPNQFRYFKMDKFVRARNFINRADEGRTIVITSQSKVAFWSPLTVEVPESHKDIGRQIVCPPPASMVQISTALAFPKKQKNSIRGRLVQEEEKKTVRAHGEEVTIKQIHVEDDSGKAKITLWREAALADIRPGDFIEVTDVQANAYMGNLSLSSTMKTMVKKVEAPVTEERLKVMGLALEEDKVELFAEGKEEAVVVPAEMLQEALFCIDGTEALDLEDACGKGPFVISLSRKGSDVLSITKVELEDNNNL